MCELGGGVSTAPRRQRICDFACRVMAIKLLTTPPPTGASVEIYDSLLWYDGCEPSRTSELRARRACDQKSGISQHCWPHSLQKRCSG